MPTRNIGCVRQVATALGYSEARTDGSGLLLFQSQASVHGVVPDIFVLGMDQVGEDFLVEEEIMVRAFEDNGNPRPAILAALDEATGGHP